MLNVNGVVALPSQVIRSLVPDSNAKNSRELMLEVAGGDQMLHVSFGLQNTNPNDGFPRSTIDAAICTFSCGWNNALIVPNRRRIFINLENTLRNLMVQGQMILKRLVCNQRKLKKLLVYSKPWRQQAHLKDFIGSRVRIAG